MGLGPASRRRQRLYIVHPWRPAGEQVHYRLAVMSRVFFTRAGRAGPAGLADRSRLKERARRQINAGPGQENTALSQRNYSVLHSI